MRKCPFLCLRTICLFSTQAAWTVPALCKPRELSKVLRGLPAVSRYNTLEAGSACLLPAEEIFVFNWAGQQFVALPTVDVFRNENLRDAQAYFEAADVICLPLKGREDPWKPSCGTKHGMI